MRRVSLLLFVFMMSVNFSGIGSLVFPEPCTILEDSQTSDSACPPSCVRCGCCAQPIVASVRLPLTFPVPLTAATVMGPIAPALGDAREILHVPKSAA